MAWRRLAMCALRVAPLAALFFALVDCLPTEQPGFEAAFQGRCGEGSPCEQLCRELHDGTFECGCEDGYVLLLDGYGCMHNNFTKTTEVSLSADVDDVLYARVTSLEAELVQAVEFDNSTTPRHVDVTTQSNIVELEAEHRKHLDGISSLISDGISKVDLNLISDDDDFSEDFKYTTLGPSLEQKVPSVTIPPPWTQSVESCDCKCQGRCSTSCNKDQCKNVQIKVPRFSGNSWLALHTLRGAYKHVRIRMRFRPERLKGVLLLTGEHDDMSGDYLALVINEGKVELRFDCGSGPAVVRSSSGVRLGRWNSVTVWRHRWDAWLKLNSQKRVKGRSEGLFSRMTFREPVWIGGSGNTTGLKSKLGISDGFIGCLDYLKINGDTVDLVKDSLASYDVGECAPSLPQWKPELTTETKKSDAEPDHVYNINDIVDFEDNDIVMRDAQKYNKDESDLNKKTYDTVSDPVAKPDMEIRRPVCDCQHGGGCVNDVCLCPLGYAGERCEITLDLKVPRFNGSSYLRLPGLGSSAESWLSIQVTIKPSTGDGILLFNSDHVGGSSDYFSLTLKNFYVEFAMDLGSGVNTVRSAYPLQANQWHRIIVNRTGRKASLAVQYLENKLNEYNNVARYVWCVGLNRRLLLRSSLALGGKAGETSFQGCVRQLVINDQEISIVASALGGVNVDNCYQEDELKCRDTKLCEENLDTLPPYKETHPHRVVPKKGTKYKKRKLKKHDVTTNDVNWVESSSYPSFSGQDSFIHIDDDETVKRLQSFSLDINIRFRSVSSEGLLVWSGVSHKTEDFMSLGIEDSVLVFRYNLGSGEVVIVANHTKVDDGLWHRARATRNRQAGVLEVDGLGSVGKISPGKLKQLNTYNGLYLGGLPTIEVNSLGKYKSGLIGCISQISLSGDFDIPLSLSKLPHTITNKVGKCTP